MGKGTIISGGDDGQYTIRMEWNADRLDAEVTRLTSRIAGYTALIATMEAGKAKDRAELEKSALERRLGVVQKWKAIYEADTGSAWCADLTEDLTGEVGTIEVPGEPTTVLIQPGYDGNAAYDSARDGQMEHPAAGTPAGVYWNWAMLPVWQKYKPTYRTGTITALDGDTADVTLDAAVSSQQALDVNQTATLTGVSIEYMSCNGEAFEVGDEVVVQFVGQDWAAPKIIGFKANPRPCTTYVLIRIGGEEEPQRRYVIWDIDRDRTVDISGVIYPCEWTAIEDWLDTRLSVSSVQAFTAGSGPSSDDSFESNSTLKTRPFISYSEDSDIYDALAWTREYPIAWGSCAIGGPWEAETETCRIDGDDTTWNDLTGYTLKHYETYRMESRYTVLSCDAADWDPEQDFGWDTAFVSWRRDVRARGIEGSVEAAGTCKLVSGTDSDVDGYLYTALVEEIDVEYESYYGLLNAGPGAANVTCGLHEYGSWTDFLEHADLYYGAPDGYRNNVKIISEKYVITTHLGVMGTLTGAQTSGPTYATQTGVGRLEGSDQTVIATRCCASASVQIYIYQALTESYSEGVWTTNDRHVFIQAAADMHPSNDGISADLTGGTVSVNLESAIEDLISAYCTAKGTADNALATISLDLSFYS